MNYIENSELESLSLFLTDREIGNIILNGKIELYSIPADKLVSPKECLNVPALYENNNKSLRSVSDSNSRPRSNSYEIFPSRPQNAKRSSSLGDLSEPSSRKLFLDLISTLNESFPDYDFQSTKLDQFVEKDVFTAIRTVNNFLAEITETDANFLEKLWHAIDQATSLRKCEIFSYISDNEGDPFSNGTMGSFNFFFFNPHRMRMCYFSCVAVSKYSANRMDISEKEDSDSDDDRSFSMDTESEDSYGKDGQLPDWEGII